MKRGLKIFVSLLLVAVIVMPSVFAYSGPGSYAYQVRIGNVDEENFVYNADIEWGNLTFDYVRQTDGSYDWKVSSEGGEYVIITNRSNVTINADIQFHSEITGLVGSMDEEKSGDGSVLYGILVEEPQDFDSSNYYLRDEENNFTKAPANENFVENKYYYIIGAGGGQANTNGNIPAVSETELGVQVSSYSWALKLSGGGASNIKAGSVAGSLVVKLS